MAVFAASAVVLFVDGAPKTVKLVLLLTAMLAYAIANYRGGNQRTIDRVQYWIRVGVGSLIWLAYLATLLNEPPIALSFLGVFLVVSILFETVGNWLALRRTNSELVLVTSYVSLSAIWILIFGVAYAWAGLEWSSPAIQDKAVSGNWPLYFSGSVYYSNAVGDVVPVGNARWIVLVESAWSVVFHVIIVARVVSNLGARREQSERQR